MSYVEIGKKLTVKEVTEHIKSKILTYKYYASCKGLYKRLKSVPEDEIVAAARCLVEINDALLAKRSVYAVCDKSPRGNLDTGRHYYSVMYVDKKGVICVAWFHGCNEALGMTHNTRHRYLRSWVFESSAIGMSRVMDATDGLFSFLRSCGGCYTQIDVL